MRSSVMKCLMVILAIFAAGSHAGDDVFAPYDGPTGMNCSWYNQGGAIRWENKGGDFADKVGEVAYKSYQSADLTMPITAGVEGIILTKTNPIKFYSKETTTGRKPTVLVNGEPSDINVIADASLVCSTTKVLGTNTVIGTEGNIAIFFDKPLPENATLVLDVYKAYSYGGVLEAYRAIVPRVSDVPVEQGLAAKYVNDEGIKLDPNVLFTIDFDDPEWIALSNKSTEPYDCKTVDSAESFDGGKVLQSLIKATTYGTGCSHHFYTNKYMGGQPEEIFMRYYVWLGDDFYGSTDGGKMPGIASEYWYDGFLLCGGGGSSCAGGKKGWTLRGGFNMNPDANNPIAPRVPFHTYAYHANQAGEYGDFWSWGALGLIELKRWTSIEWRVKVNTPGVKDGILQVWVDGRMALDKQGIELRGELPWDPRIGQGQMLIKDAPWIVNFYGGKNPPYVRDHTALFDKFVVAKSYIGPVGTKQAEPEQPAPIEPKTIDQRFEDLERRIGVLEEKTLN